MELRPFFYLFRCCVVCLFLLPTKGSVTQSVEFESSSLIKNELLCTCALMEPRMLLSIKP